MKTAEEAIREFAENWGQYYGGDENDPGWVDETDKCFAELTALISEHYVAKEKADELLFQLRQCRKDNRKILNDIER